MRSLTLIALAAVAAGCVSQTPGGPATPAAAPTIGPQAVSALTARTEFSSDVTNWRASVRSPYGCIGDYPLVIGETVTNGMNGTVAAAFAGPGNDRVFRFSGASTDDDAKIEQGFFQNTLQVDIDLAVDVTVTDAAGQPVFAAALRGEGAGSERSNFSACTAVAGASRRAAAAAVDDLLREFVNVVLSNPAVRGEAFGG